jgi:sugar porter (SP) family MFS transporter
MLEMKEIRKEIVLDNSTGEEIDSAAAHRSLNPTEIDCFKHCPFLMYSTVTASFGGVIFGFDTAALNGVLVMPSFLDVMGKAAKTDEEWAVDESWIVSSLLLACFFGALFAAPLSDTYGRKWCIITAMFFTAVGSCVQAGATTLTTMIAGRVVVGIFIGLLSGIVPVYLAEVAPKSIRGSVGSFFYLTLAVGILFAFLVTLALNKFTVLADGSNDINKWRYILAVQAALAIFLVMLMVPIPESPRWLLNMNYNEKARKVLQQTRWCLPVGRRRNDDGIWEIITNIDLEYEEIVDEVKVNMCEESAWYDFAVLLRPNMILRTSMGILIQFFQQLSGINSFFYYSSVIYKTLGIVPDVTTAVTGAVSVAATLISVLLIDYAGRRTLLILGSIGMMCSLIVVGAIILQTGSVNDIQRDAITVFICLYVVNFSYSYGPIAWLYPPETFPLHIRAKGTSISTAANWLADFAVAKSVPGLLQPGSAVGGVGGLFLFFAGWCLIMTLWAIFNVHETTNLSLEHVDEVFGIRTWSEYAEYIWKNLCYTFYYGDKTMFQYTQHGGTEYHTSKSKGETDPDTSALSPIHDGVKSKILQLTDEKV